MEKEESHVAESKRFSLLSCFNIGAWFEPPRVSSSTLSSVSSSNSSGSSASNNRVFSFVRYQHDSPCMLMLSCDDTSHERHRKEQKLQNLVYRSGSNVQHSWLLYGPCDLESRIQTLLVASLLSTDENTCALCMQTLLHNAKSYSTVLRALVHPSFCQMLGELICSSSNTLAQPAARLLALISEKQTAAACMRSANIATDLITALQESSVSAFDSCTVLKNMALNSKPCLWTLESCGLPSIVSNMVLEQRREDSLFLLELAWLVTRRSTDVVCALYHNKLLNAALAAFARSVQLLDAHSASRSAAMLDIMFRAAQEASNENSHSWLYLKALITDVTVALSSHEGLGVDMRSWAANSDALARSLQEYEIEPQMWINSVLAPIVQQGIWLTV